MPSVAPGGTAQFHLTATGAAGLAQDVSRDAAWKSANPELLQSLGGGVFRAGETRGETNLTAIYGSGSSALHVLVLEAGTFVVRGTVSDTGVALPGAHVQVSTGIGADQSATTDTSGRYALYGVAGSVTLNATETAYQPQAQTLDVSGDSTANFSLLLLGARPDINGNWRLTFTASAACTELPEDARVRVYPVSIHQTGPAAGLTLTLTSSAWPLTDSISINARLFSQSLTFAFPVDAFDGPSVYEHLTGGQEFTLEGNASALYVGGGFDGIIDGRVRVFTAATWPGTTCTQAAHHWRLDRTPPS